MLFKIVLKFFFESSVLYLLVFLVVSSQLTSLSRVKSLRTPLHILFTSSSLRSWHGIGWLRWHGHGHWQLASVAIAVVAIAVVAAAVARPVAAAVVAAVVAAAFAAAAATTSWVKLLVKCSMPHLSS